MQRRRARRQRALRREINDIKFCKAKITKWEDVLKSKTFDLTLDERRRNLASFNLSVRGNICEFNLDNMSPSSRENFFNFFEENKIYYPDRKIKMFGRFYKFHDRRKPNPLFYKRELEGKNLSEIKEICRRFRVNQSNKDKNELISAIMRYQRTGDIGKKENCFDGIPLSLLKPLDRGEINYEDYDLNTDINSRDSINIVNNNG